MMQAEQSYATLEAAVSGLKGLRESLKRTVKHKRQQRQQAAFLEALHGPEILPNDDRLARPKRVSYTERRMDGTRDVRAGHMGRTAMRTADVFDRAPLNTLDPALIAVARRYATLHAYANGSGYRSCLASLLPGGGSSDSPGDTRARVMDEYWRMCAAIGSGVALEVQRTGSAKRGMITDRYLIDAICLADMPLGQVLKAHGWNNKTEYRGKLLAASERILRAVMI